MESSLVPFYNDIRFNKLNKVIIKIKRKSSVQAFLNVTLGVDISDVEIKLFQSAL